MDGSVYLAVVLILTLALPCLSQKDMFSVVVDVDKNSISLGVGDMNICKAFTCPQGTKCEVQTSPALLKIPIPRCVPDKEAPTPSTSGVCKQVKVATNILQCKTQEQWSRVGITQCKLNTLQGQPTRPVSARAWHVCPMITFPPAIRYLSASFNCCISTADERAELTTEFPDATPTHQSSVTTRTNPTTRINPTTGTNPTSTASSEETENPVTTRHSKSIQTVVKEKLKDFKQQTAKLAGIDSTETTDDQQTSSMFYLLLIVLALSFILSFLLISLLVSMRVKQHRRRSRQKQAVVMSSIVNPSATDMEYDHVNSIYHSNDKSSLVDNLQVAIH